MNNYLPSTSRKRSHAFSPSAPPDAKRWCGPASENSRHLLLIDDYQHEKYLNDHLQSIGLAEHSTDSWTGQEDRFSLLDLPNEILYRILRHLDLGMAQYFTEYDIRHGMSDYKAFNRIDIFHARATCKSFKSIVSSDSIWATHLLLHSNCFNLAALHSMSPFLHDQTSVRHVTTLAIVIEDSLSEMRRSETLLVELLSHSRVQNLALIRRCEVSETFVRSRVATNMTPVEIAIDHLCESTSLLQNLSRLTLANVILRPTLIHKIYNKCSRLTQLECRWSKVTLPHTDKLKEKSNRILVPNHLVPPSDTTPEGTSAIHSTIHQNNKKSRSMPTLLLPEAELMLCSPPTDQAMRLSVLHLAGPASVPFNIHWVTSTLQHLHLDTSSVASHVNWTAMQQGIEAIPTTCINLISLFINLGNLAISFAFDLGPVITKIQSPTLAALCVKNAIPISHGPQLITLFEQLPNLRTLELSFCRSVLMENNPPATAAAVATNPDSTASISNFTFLTNSGSFLPLVSNFKPLVGLFGNLPTNSTANSANSANAGPGYTCNADLSIQASILEKLSSHCPKLVRLRLEATDSLQVSPEDWTSLHFPHLEYFKYNLSMIPSNAFDRYREKFPKLVHLNLDHTHIQDRSSLYGLVESRGLHDLRCKGSHMDPTWLLPVFENRRASSSLRHLDLRVAKPNGVDSLMIQRIAFSCPKLKYFAFASSSQQKAPIVPQTVSTLLKQCKRLETVQSDDHIMFTPVIADLIKRNGVQLIRS